MNNNDDNNAFIWYILFAVIFCIIVFFLYIAGGKLQKNSDYSPQENIYIKNEKEIEQLQNTEPKAKIPEQGFTRYKFSYKYTIKIKGNISNLTFKVFLPQDEKGIQYISSLKITPQPRKMYHDGVNNIAEYSFYDLNTREIPFVMEGIADLRTYDLTTAKAINKNIYPEKNLPRYLNAEPYIESNDPYIRKIAAGIKGSTQEKVVEEIFDYVQDHIRYTLINKIASAKEALLLGYGKCSEYSVIMTALCRAKNIPARVVTGDIARDKYTKHNWVEVYFKEYGWVTYDPTEMGTLVYRYRGKNIEKTEKRVNAAILKNKYLTLARNKLSPWYISYSVDGGSNGNVSVDEVIVINKIK